MSDKFNYNDEHEEELRGEAPQHSFDLEGFPPQSVRVGFALALVFLAAVSGSVFPKGTATEEKGSTLARVYSRAATVPAPTVSYDPFAGISLNARAAYVFDVATGRVLFAKNEHEKLPLASLTKMMTGLVVSDQKGRDAVVTINENDVRQEGDSGLRPGENFRLADLLRFTLVGSSNDGAHALAASILPLPSGDGPSGTTSSVSTQDQFVALMNARAHSLGLNGTVYKNSTGLDLSDTEAGAYGTAHDMAKLAAYITRTHPSLFSSTQSNTVTVSSLGAMRHTATNTNDGVENMPGIIASKTGYTALAGGNLVVVVDAGLGRPVTIAVLGSTEAGRVTDVQALINATLVTLNPENSNKQSSGNLTLSSEQI